MKFTVIIPHHNAQDTLQRAIGSASSATELIVVPDHDQRGPGWARNEGLDRARGDWIVFLDADDELAPNALTELSDHIEAIGELDLVDYGPNEKNFEMTRVSMLRKYLRFQMDGSVVYTAFRKSFLDKHELRFAEGYHEDVDFMFKAYKYADGISHINEQLYIKHETPGQITASVTKKHIDGIFRAWREVGKEMPAGMEMDYKIGLTNMVATRHRAIHKQAEELYEYVQNQV